MAIPQKIVPSGLHDYLAIMSRAIFQAGLSWALIERKWPAFERCFYRFDPVVVAAMGEGDIEQLAADPSIVRTRKKIAATVENARTMLALDREHGGFAKYLRAFDSYDALTADLKTRFKFLGDLSVYYFLFRVGEPVPPFEEWEKTVEGDHPRIREMVGLDRLSSER